MKKKLVIFALIISVLIFSLTAVSAENSKTFTLTDPATDITYEILINGKSLSVKRGSEIISETTVQDISACTIYNNIIYIYYADNLNNALLVYDFDFYNESINLFAVNSDALYNENCFASDGEKIYFVSGKDTGKLCVYHSGSVENFDLNAQIKEILLIDKGIVIAVTSAGTFIYNNAKINIADYSLSPHIKYIGSGIVKDSLGRDFYIDKGNLVESMPETTCTTTAKAQAHIPPEIEKGFYKTQAGITVSKIKKAFADLEITRFTKADGTIIKSGKLGTGADFTLSSGDVITVIICGELTGEGNVNSRDLKAVLNHLSGKELLSGANLIAADVNEDTAVNTKDALLIAQMY